MGRKEKPHGRQSHCKRVGSEPPVTRPLWTCLSVAQSRLAKRPGYLVEKYHALHLLRCLTKRKQAAHNWPFRSVELWPSYCQNRRYDHSVDEQLDWKIMQFKLCHDEFKGFDDFKRSLQKMFNNSLRCFPNDRSIYSAVNTTNLMLLKQLGFYKQSMQTMKLKIQKITAKRIASLKSHVVEQMLLQQRSSQ